MAVVTLAVVAAVVIFGSCHSGGDSLTFQDALGRDFTGVALSHHPRVVGPMVLLPRRSPLGGRQHPRVIADRSGRVLFSRMFTESEVPPRPPFVLTKTCLERAFDG